MKALLGCVVLVPALAWADAVNIQLHPRGMVGKSFPSAAPVFSLVSMSGSSAEIGIAGGSYESGAATVTLTKGKTVTLLNTADGTRYVLRLVAAA